MIFKCLFVIYVISDLFLGVYPQALPTNWVDPYDMTPSDDYYKYSDQKPALHSQKDGKTDLSNLYLRRIINLLLNSVHEDIIDPNLFSGHLFFKIDSEKYEFLKNFGDGNSENLEKVDKILTEIFEKPSYEFLQKYLENYFHKFLTVLLSREGILSVVIACYTFVLYQLFKQHFSYFKIFKFLLINFFIFDFIFTWVHLYQKFMAEYVAKSLKYDKIPVECQPDQMNSLQFLAQFFKTKDQCKEYFEYRYEDIFYKVTPGLVLSEIFTRTVTYPAQKVGVAFGELCNGIYGAFPFPLNLIFLPVLLLFFCLLTCILLSIILGKTIKFNFFHLISFSFGNPEEKKRDQITEKKLKQILKNQHRNFIELIEDKRNDDLNVKQLKNVEKKKIKQKTIEYEQKTVENEQKTVENEQKTVDTGEKTNEINKKTKECCEIIEETDKNASGDHQ